jgi:hypothetical protein
MKVSIESSYKALAFIGLGLLIGATITHAKETLNYKEWCEKNRGIVMTDTLRDTHCITSALEIKNERF